MKKVIDGKVYNTETAEEIENRDNGCYGGDFHQCEEHLYLTKNGRWFLYGEGGPMSKYSRPEENNGWTGGRAIIPLSESEVIELLEKWNKVDALEKYFPGSLEEA